MTSYTYDDQLPQNVVGALIHALRVLAAKQQGTVTFWYHDLPIWILRAHEGPRVNRVQVDAVVVDGKRLLVLTPDAYEDRPSAKDSHAAVVRSTANPDAVSQGCMRLDLTELLYDAESTDEDAIARPIWAHLYETFNYARDLPLDVARSWIASTP